MSLVAVSAVHFLAVRYVLVGEAQAENKEAYAFASCAGGAVMAATGFHIALTWPLPAQYNIAFGEALATFGALLIAGVIFGLIAAMAILHHLAPGSFDGWVPR